MKLLELSPKKLGAGFLVVALVAGFVAFNRNVISTTFTPGQTLTATFARNYGLRDYASTVKIAGVVVGTVIDTAEENGRSVVTMKLRNGTLDKLGSAPSAAIRPTTMLGGVYYVDLAPSLDHQRFGGEGIPLERTRIAVETGTVVQSLQPDARRGARAFVDKLDATLRQGGQDAVHQLTRDAPATLRPAGPTFDAMTGEQPDDLRELVSGLDDTARVLTKQRGQIQEILSSLDTTSGALDKTKQPVADTLNQLPATLRSTRAGMASLKGTLVQLTDTAEHLQPVADELNPLLRRANPVLERAQPVVNDLRQVLRDARPLVDRLVPVASKTTRTLDHLDGSVLDNLNGPILGALNSTWHGVGPYAGNDSKYYLYQDIAYMFTNATAAAKTVDKNGAQMSIQVGQGLDGAADFKGVPNLEPFVQGLPGQQVGNR